VALKAGSCTAEHYEPRQVREEAAVNSSFWVLQGYLVGVGWLEQAMSRGRGQVRDLTFVIDG
jgi:hypothetical protein